MTLQELRQKVRVERDRGFFYLYKVTITYRGREYTCKSNNSLAWDRLDDDNYRDNEVNGFYTNKGAYKAFYEECKRKNNLGEYKY
jgi:hypothetical protein